MADDPGFGTAAAASGAKVARILPAFRPDKAMNAADAAAWKAYAATLGQAAGVEIRRFADLAEALSRRHAFFHAMGCRLSDHALIVPPFAPALDSELDAIVASLLAGKEVDAISREKLATAVLLHVAGLNARAGWVMQLHIGALRNVNTRLFRSYGPDGGGDSISDAVIVPPLAGFLDALDLSGSLPKTILYSLDDTKIASLASLAQCYAGTYDGSGKGTAAKLQYGAAWWFNDHLDGMTRQFVQTASVASIGGWVGMLTDSRSLLSYPRHEYFRRLLCRIVGRWVDEGELPDDEAYALSLVRNISWFNARDYLGIVVPEWAREFR
jgi:glucuronate isomerase